MIFNGVQGYSETPGIYLESIEITSQPQKTEYKSGETFDPDGMVVKANYTNGLYMDVGGYTWSPSGPLMPGTSVVTIQYTEAGRTATATVDIEVSGGTTVGELEVGAEIQLNVDGVPTDFIIVHQGNPDPSMYDESCDGTWVLMKDCYEKREWNSTNSNSYSGSSVNSYLNNDFVGLFDDNVKNNIKTVKIPYRPSDGTATTVNYRDNGLSTQVFLLSVRETGSDKNYYTSKLADGVKLEYFLSGTNDTAANKRIAHYGNSAIMWWSRSPWLADKYSACYVGSDGSINGANCTNSSLGIRPAFVLPSDFRIGKASVYGVCWNYGNNNTKLERLTPDTDPYEKVSTTINTEPVAAVGDGEGSSPFDGCMPWSGMEEYNILSDGRIIKSGEDGFSRTANDTMVYIPEFWYMVADDASNQKRYFYVADAETEGFEKHPGSGRYLSRYTASSGYLSKTGQALLTSISRTTARKGCRGKGIGWQQYDFATYCAVCLLYIVEYADWDSQTKIGQGYTSSSNSSAIVSGKTDSMTYHTGRASGTNGQTAVQYRHLENLWGNVYQLVDGINFSSRAAYVCTDPSKYADDTTTGYTSAGLSLPSSNGYISGLGNSTPFTWAFIPNAARGSASTYIPDYVLSNTSWQVLCVGSDWNSATHAGLFSFRGNISASYTYASIGARLLYIPQET